MSPPMSLATDVRAQRRDALAGRLFEGILGPIAVRRGTARPGCGRLVGSTAEELGEEGGS